MTGINRVAEVAAIMAAMKESAVPSLTTMSTPILHKAAITVESGIMDAAKLQVGENLLLVYDSFAAEVKANIMAADGYLAHLITIRIKAILLAAHMPHYAYIFLAIAEKAPPLWRLGGMLPHELNPPVNAAYFARLALKMEARVPQKFSRMYQCRCGERKTELYEIQTRSLDEPKTLYIRCLCCGRSWTSSR